MINELFNSSELALAAYANLTSGSTNDPARRDALSAQGMSAKQAEEFAKRYPTIVTQYNDTLAEGGLGTSFSATVFKDTSGNLTLAFRGTLGSGDLTPTDATIATQGAGYDQIIAMWNWMQRLVTPAGQTVPQYELLFVDDFITPPQGAIFLYSGNEDLVSGSYYLATGVPVTATGELATELTADADHRLDLSGHSLGGHLAMAFGALFPDITDHVTVFNAPGFKSSSANDAFFAQLGGAVPTGVNTTNVIANEANVGDSPWNEVAGLHSRPGAAVDIPIEDQWLSALNHSQQPLTDALAVYATLNKLDPAVTSESFKNILAGAANSTVGGLEGIVDTLEGIFGINTTPLPTGNIHRDDLYQALYDLKDSVLFDQVNSLVTVQSLAQQNASAIEGLARTDIAYRYALVHLTPFAIFGDGSLYSQHNTGGELDTDHFTDTYLKDRAEMLYWKLKYNSEDKAYNETYTTSEVTGNWDYVDYEQVIGSAYGGDPLTLQIDGNGVSTDHQIIFGSESRDTLTGDKLEDHLYGGAGNDTSPPLGSVQIYIDRVSSQ